MPGAADYQNIPTDILAAGQRSDDADQWAADQRAQVAQQWGDAQRSQLPPQNDIPPDFSSPDVPASPGGNAGVYTSSGQYGPDAQGSAGAAAPPAPVPLPSGAGQSLTAAPDASPAPAVPSDDAAPTPYYGPTPTPAARTSQFGLGLSTADAMAFCGPTAAIAFAQTYGRNPTVGEAKQLAQQVGWNPNLGMAGIASEQALLTKMGVQTKLEQGPVNRGKVAEEVLNGNPVIISTPGHYFYVDGVDPKTGAFHVGTSGTDLRQGAEWMTLDRMELLEGSAHGALYADHPLAQGPSVAEQNPLSELSDAAGSAFSKIGQKASQVVQAVQNVGQGAANAIDQTVGPNSPFAQQVGGIAGGRGLNPGDIVQAANAPSEALGTAIVNASPSLQTANAQAGGIPEKIAQAGVGLYAGAIPGAEGAGAVKDASGVMGALGENATDLVSAFKAAWPEQLKALQSLGAGPAEIAQAQKDLIGELSKSGVTLNAGMTPADLAKPLNSTFQPVANLPQPVQDAIARFANVVGHDSKASKVLGENFAHDIQAALGDADSTQAAQLIDSFEKTGTFGPNATPEQQKLAAELKQYFADTLAQGQAGGYISGDVSQQGTQYFPHVYTDDQGAASVAANQARSTSPNDFFSQGRKYPTIADAIAAGKQPAPLSQAVARYAGHVTDSEAKVQLVRDLQASQPDAVVAIGPQGDVPEGMVRGSTIDPYPTSPLRQFAFDPDAARAIKNVLAPSAIAQNPLGQAALKATGTAKQTVFSLSGFHPFTLTETSYLTSPKVGNAFVRAFASPQFYDGVRNGPLADTFVAAARAGVTGLAQRVAPDVEGQIGNPIARAATQAIAGGAGAAGTGFVGTKVAGGSNQDALRNAGIAGGLGAVLGPTAGQAVTSGLWDRGFKLAKVMAWDVERQHMGDMAAAQVVNQRFGGLNYAAMGRSQTVQDALRLTVMAPDWNEATLRQLGSAFFGGNAPEAASARGFLGKAVVGTAAATEALQYGLTGHFTDQNQAGHQFQLEIPTTNGKFQWISVGPGNVQAYMNLADRLATRPDARGAALAEFGSGRLSVPLQEGGTLYNGITGNPNNDVKKAGLLPALAARLSPIGAEQVTAGAQQGVPLPESFIMAATGINPTYGGTYKPPPTSGQFQFFPGDGSGRSSRPTRSSERPSRPSRP